MATDPASGDSLHPVAAQGFGSSPHRYESGRPGYPAAAVSWLCERLGIRKGAVVADVAAGTGKLTRSLAATGARVVAVEPVSGMAQLLATLTPDVELVAATAEALPFAGGSIDAITAAQAFHWFDAERAWAEFHRVLRRGGGVGLMWNVRDRSVAWIDQVWTIMDEVEKNAPWRNHDRSTQTAGTGFTPLESATFWHEVSVTRQGMMDRIASVSHVAILPEPERKAILARVAAALPAGTTLSVRYRVDVYVTHKE
jgi:SAM-dependent methyltransferase